MDKTLAWLWLADAVGSACQYAQELLTLYPDPAELYDALRAGTEAPPACLTPHALAQLRDTTLFDYEERLDHCLLSGIDVLTPDEGVYPDRLRDLPDLPLALYVTGDIACLNGRRYAGMVGTRRPSTYGRQAAFDLSLAMARAGVVLVSGLADGLDSEAHRAAVQADVPTIAFLGTAIDKTYPASNAKLRTAIEKYEGEINDALKADLNKSPFETYMCEVGLTLSEILVSAGLYSPPPVKKLSCCPAVAGGTRPLVPAADAVAPSYSGTEMMPFVSRMPSPIEFSEIIFVQFDHDVGVSSVPVVKSPIRIAAAFVVALKAY